MLAKRTGAQEVRGAHHFLTPLRSTSAFVINSRVVPFATAAVIVDVGITNIIIFIVAVAILLLLLLRLKLLSSSFLLRCCSCCVLLLLLLLLIPM